MALKSTKQKKCEQKSCFACHVTKLDILKSFFAVLIMRNVSIVLIGREQVKKSFNIL